MNAWEYIELVLFVAIPLFFVIYYLLYLKKYGDITNEDFSEANFLGMPINRYKYYQKIFNEQMECHRKGISPPKIYFKHEDEWMRYGHTQLEKIDREIADDLEKARNNERII